MSHLLDLALWNSAILLCVVLGLVVTRGRSFRWPWLLVGMLLFNINVTLVTQASVLNLWLEDVFALAPLDYNWLGKTAALLVSIGLLSIGLFDRREAGITLRQSKGASAGWIVLLIFCIIAVMSAMNMADEPQTAEGIAYQLTMPSFEEEIFYRGIFLLCLVKALGDGPRFLGANFGAGAFIATFAFAIIHALYWGTSGPSLEMGNFIFAGVFGLMIMWMRLNTGSVVVPILMHSAVNTIWRLF